jgi:uncharacterized protein (TIGR03435 family)
MSVTVSKNLLCILLSIAAFELTGQIINVSKFPEIDKEAPMLSINQWLENPSYPIKDMKDKVIVLDFWFTSCAPCIYTIPHLNDLSEKYKSENVVFVALTFEKKERVMPFLKKVQIKANVGTDTTKQIIQAFGVHSYPQTFVIDVNGVLKWIGYPSMLTSDVIDKLLLKKLVVNPETPISTKVKKSDLDERKIYPIKVSKNDYMENASGAQFNSEELTIVNQTLKTLVGNAMQVSPNRVLTTDTNRYDVRFKVPSDVSKENLKDIIAESILKELKYKASIAEKQMDGFELTILNDSLFVNNAIDTSAYYGSMATSSNGNWKGVGVQIPALIRELESRFNVYVDDVTKLNVFMKLTLPINSFDEVKKTLLEKYGLVLVPKKVRVEFIKIDSAPSRSSN